MILVWLLVLALIALYGDVWRHSRPEPVPAAPRLPGWALGQVLGDPHRHHHPSVFAGVAAPPPAALRGAPYVTNQIGATP